MADQNALARRAPEFLRSKGISGRTAKLLIGSPDDPGQFTTGFGLGLTVSISANGVSCAPMKAADPSTIFTRLAVRAPRDMASVPHPPYYPSYMELSPEQRWVYLSWLKDVRQPIYIGYVFIYYYGLERHLLLGDYDSAF
ncbi:MAG: TerB N-terminal domain-containing protein, partial [Nitrososphaera sp.]|nr:TerB N-terminal domain-containing protein [Nitrososphaera sp.]